jgi:hypothetical protein
MDDEPKAPVTDEQPLDVTEAEQGGEDAAPDAASAPDLTPLEALKNGIPRID